MPSSYLYGSHTAFLAQCLSLFMLYLVFSEKEKISVFKDAFILTVEHFPKP